MLSLIMWWENEGQRAFNVSVAYKGKPEIGTFMREWVACTRASLVNEVCSTVKRLTNKLPGTSGMETGHMGC